MSYICFNGRFLPADEPVLVAGNRSYRYGDGLFETMRVEQGKILLANYHFERFFSSIPILKMDIPGTITVEQLTDEIYELCKMNGCVESARVRLSVSRGNGSLSEQNLKIDYLIECKGLAETHYKLNDEGLRIDIYPLARKSCDIFSNLKSANFLPYVMAAGHAKENHLDDCLVLNMSGNIADSTIANIFIFKDETVLTPSLDQGCVNGVMRRYLIERIRDTGYKTQETSISISDLENADEIFLTNAIKGIQWVGKFRNNRYSNTQTKRLYNDIIQKIGNSVYKNPIN